jgi:predicted short-subunit dehydrogenase-like oxidoreductase (DUF2520 family)
LLRKHLLSSDRYLKLRELERDPSLHATALKGQADAPVLASRADAPATGQAVSLAIIGRGRLGNALAPALRGAGYGVKGPLGRDADPTGVDAVLLCVPDGEIAAAAGAVSPGRPVGHCSGATGLDALAAHEAFSLHPLMTVTEHGADFRGAGAAVDGSTPAALRLAQELALALGMHPVRIPDQDRALYHAAASIASNFLVSLEAAAERLAAAVGVEHDLLVPLVRATVENWATLGAGRALTGPVVRGDEATVAAQRAAIAERAPELTDLFDALVESTRALAREPQPA